MLSLLAGFKKEASAKAARRTDAADRKRKAAEEADAAEDGDGASPEAAAKGDAGASEGDEDGADVQPARLDASFGDVAAAE